MCHVLVTVMVGRIKLSFHHRVFILLLTFCWVLVGTFMVFQYFREKEFKTELSAVKSATDAGITVGVDALKRNVELLGKGLEDLTEKTEKMEKLPLSETTDSKRGSSGRENLDFKRVWETLLREYRLF